MSERIIDIKEVRAVEIFNERREEDESVIVASDNRRQST